MSRDFRLRSYLVGRGQGVRPEWIFTTAETGNRSGDSLRQARRLMKNLKGDLPDQVLILFAGNDLCSLGLNEDLNAVQTGWADRVLEGVNEMITQGKTKGTDIFILPALDPTDLIDSESVLEKKVYAFGAERSCRSFRDFDPSTVDESSNITSLTMKLFMKLLKANKNLPDGTSECRSVLSIKKGSADYATRLANMQRYSRAIQMAAADVVKRAEDLIKAKGITGIRVRLLKATENFRAEGEDVANDCFHLSLRGHEKLARAILKEIAN